MNIYPLTIALGLLTLTLPVAADTFIMKDGSKLNGSILRQDATSYVLEVQVTKTIKDEKVVPKADVLKIEPTAPVQTDFASIRQLVPVPDLLTTADYTAKISTVEKYIKEHRMTSTSKEAQEILDNLKAEAAVIATGAIKLDGKIIPAAERQTNAYEIDARIQATKIRRLVTNSQTLPALRAFTEMQRSFPNTSASNSLIPLMTQVITSYLAETLPLAQTYEARTKARQTGLTRMTAIDRRSSETAIREQTAELTAKYQQEKDAKIDWVTSHPFSKPALEDTLTFGKQELVRLAALKNAPPVDGGKAFRDAMICIQTKGDPAAVKAAINDAKTAMVPERYLAILEAASQPASTTAP